MDTDNPDMNESNVAQEIPQNITPQPDENINNMLRLELSDKLTQAWETVQAQINECENCPNELIALRKAERTLSQAYNGYCSISTQYSALLNKINTQECTDEINRQSSINSMNADTVNKVMSDIDTRIEHAVETMSHKTKSSHSRRSKSSMGSLMVKIQAKAEAAKALTTFTLQEANLRKRQAQINEQQQIAAARSTCEKATLEADLEVLQHHKHLAAAEAELKAVQQSEGTISSGDPPPDLQLPTDDPVQRTLRYVEKHSDNKTHRDSFIEMNTRETTNQVCDPYTPIVSQQPDVSYLCNTSLPNRKIVDNNITDPNNLTSTLLNPNAQAYTPGPPYAYSSPSNMPGQYVPLTQANQNTMANDFTTFLLKRDLLLTRLFQFIDKPESYSMWKMSFQNVMAELHVNAGEELDLLIKWLGPESTKHALSLRAANVRDPVMGRQRVWERLDERYGCPEMVEAALRSKLTNFPKLTNKDSAKLYELCDILSEIASIKEDPVYMTSLSYFDSSTGIIPIVSKLPYGMQEKWTSHASNYKKHNGVTFPPFSCFVQFMQELAKIKNDPSFSYEQSPIPLAKNKQPVQASGKNVLSRKTEIKPTKPNIPSPDVYCPIHTTKHALNKCRGFKQKNIEERNKLLKELGICFRCCASTEHTFRECTAAIECSECGSSKHCSAMHRNTYFPPKSTTATPWKDNGGETTSPPKAAESSCHSPKVTSKCTEICGENFQGKSCGKTIQVKVYPHGRPQSAQIVYAILDDQSNASLAHSDLFDKFQSNVNRIPYTLSSCSGLVQMTGRKGTNFMVEALDGSTVVQIPTVIECNQIPNMRQEIPTPEVALHHPHLNSIAQHIPPVNDNADILLLIGRDVVEAHHVIDHRIGPRGSPYAQRLPLGWVIIGEACLGKVHRPDVLNVNKTNILENGRSSIFRPCPNSFDLKQTLTENKLRQNSCVFPEDNKIGSSVFEITKNDHKIGMSMEDKLFLEIMDSGFIKEEGGNWTAPLPLKDPRPRLPNNRPQAVKRAQNLHNSLQRDPIKREHFVTFMQGILDHKHAELAPPLPENEECWYLPLFGVYHPKKPEQIRGVFDSSAKFEGLSLNDVLLSGPDMTNSLLGILLRFRLEPIAITGDIQQMFHCFLVKPEHRNFLRFLWYENNNPDNRLVEYRMRVHVFGNCASPAVATYGIRKAAEVAEPTYGSDVKQFVNRDFYVDDALKSLPSPEAAIDLMKRTQEALMSAGNLRLHKIASNSVQVMESFPAEDRSKDLKYLNLGSDTLPLQRSLGLCWDLRSDTFRFQVNPEEKPYTKRGVLSTINSLFDPLGFVSPVLIGGRILLRELMSQDTTWDEPLSPELHKEWKKWRDSLKQLEKLLILRPYIGLSMERMTDVKLHIFSDASEKAIAAVAYLRAVDEPGEAYSGFVMGKTKVAPKHGHTVPRLELCAAVLAVEMAEIICEHLNLNLSVAHFYTDSRIVLGYIYNQTRRFYVYVSNRIARIRKSTEPCQWKYISTERNPADQATRSIPSTDLQTSTWLTGPPDLTTESSENNYPLEDPDNDMEVRSRVITVDTKIQTKLGCHRFERFSTWKQLVNAIANLKKLAMSQHSNVEQLADVDVYADTEKFVIRQVQEEIYGAEVNALKNNKPLPKKSSLLPLNPVLNGQSLLCVGGRLNRSRLPVGQRNPLIIPPKHHIATLLVRHYHQNVQHQGRHLTEGAARSAGLWIVGGKRLIATVLKQCVTCRKLRGKAACQQMADLPPDRLTAGPPFTFVGLDTFGPWPVVSRRTRGGQASSKRWAILFTCLATRAIHIEIVEEMTSSCFINSLRRFIAIRGKVKEFRSDRGTNFVGSLDNLEVDSVNIEDAPIKNFLYDKGTKWTFNPPHSSHMGGVWERMIGVTRRILDSMLLQANTKNLTHEVLSTFLAEVTAIVNARPLVPVSTDPEAPTILSPATLLTQKVNHVSEFAEDLDVKDIYRAQWKHVQVLAEAFWKSWRDEYLQALQPRRKWQTDYPNLKIGDIVLLKSKETHRNEWPVGILTNVYPSEDGKVRKVEVRVTKDGARATYPRPISDVVLLVSE